MSTFPKWNHESKGTVRDSLSSDECRPKLMVSLTSPGRARRMWEGDSTFLSKYHSVAWLWASATTFPKEYIWKKTQKGYFSLVRSTWGWVSVCSFSTCFLNLMEKRENIPRFYGKWNFQRPQRDFHRLNLHAGLLHRNNLQNKFFFFF